MDFNLELLKKTLTVIVLFAIVGFIVYKIGWKNNNILTAGSSNLVDLHSDKDYNHSYNYYNDNDNEGLNQIQDHISKQSDLDILQCYQNTSDLRMRLLNKQLRATDIIDSKHLLPKGIYIPKEDDYEYQQNNINIDRVNPDISQIKQGSANVNYPTMITNIPNYF